MESRVEKYIKSLSKEGRLRFLANLTLHLGEAARAEYPLPEGQSADAIANLGLSMKSIRRSHISSWENWKDANTCR
jgi:hypothetical protein